MGVLKSLNCAHAQTSTFFNRQVWEGEEKVIIAIDCGTTFSGVAYSYLFPKGDHYVQRVLQWPGQASHKGEAKIPTLVWYDEKGKAGAFGAEAITPEVRELAEKEGWQLAEHFKLHLHPHHLRAEHDIVVQPLPTRVPLEQIYADFFGYLHEHTKKFFQGREIDGEKTWNRLEESGAIEWVIASPNAWGPWEHGMLRKAAILGGLVPVGQSHQRIQMVTEAEASAHYVLSYAGMYDRLKVGTEIIICDAGGSTVDTTLYMASRVDPILELQEKQSSGCIQAGAIFVNQAVHKYFDGLLSSTKINSQDSARLTREAVESFENGPKKTFQGPKGDFTIDVGGHKFSDASVGIRRGRKTLSGTQMESFFMPLANQIINEVHEQMKGNAVKYIMLVGGFGDSPYLRKRLQSNPMFKDTKVMITNDSAAKAVAEGAVLSKIQHAVTTRATRFSYGIEVNPDHEPNNPEHTGRKVRQSCRGPVVDKVWSEIVTKGQGIKVDEYRRRNYFRFFSYIAPEISSVEVIIYVRPADEPANVPPYFMKSLSGEWLHGIQKACTLSADMSNAKDALVQYEDPEGRPYLGLFYDVLVYFGRTELVAQLVWKDAQGKEHRSDVAVIPEKF